MALLDMRELDATWAGPPRADECLALSRASAVFLLLVACSGSGAQPALSASGVLEPSVAQPCPSLPARTGSGPKYPNGLWLYGCESRAPSTPMPQFDWPPPPWTAHHTLAPAATAQETLGDVFLRVRSMLRHADLLDAGLFAIGDDGFAAVTRVESIGDDGRPRVDTGRFAFDPDGNIQRKFSLKNYLDILFNRSPGRFRLFAILVTPSVVAPNANSTITWAQVHRTRGAAQLPSSLASAKVAPGTSVTVLVYEFLKPTPDSAPAVLTESQLSAQQHLTTAGLLPESPAP